MEGINIYQVDAFTDELFKGNPAAICILDHWLEENIMQDIAAENNLAETAFVVPEGNKFNIRWFTPTVEVDLCGHATLAAGFVLYNFLNYQKNKILFFSPRSGDLKIIKKGELLELDFPADTIKRVEFDQKIETGIGSTPLEVYKGKDDYLAVLKSEDEVKNVTPDFRVLSQLNSRGLIITAPGNEVDFVSRFFAPQSGINEDPVTGSAHTSLVPYWANKLNKKHLKAKQISQREGSLICEDAGSRVKIGGKAKLYMIGKIYL